MSNAPFALSANTTYVIGHRNPDADSICAAIAYAAYKEALGERGHVAARCGNSNARIDTILGRFRQPLPVYLSDVWPRVRDLMDADVAAVPQNRASADSQRRKPSRCISSTRNPTAGRFSDLARW